MIVAGIGSRKGVSAAEVIAAIDAALAGAWAWTRSALSALATGKPQAGRGWHRRGERHDEPSAGADRRCRRLRPWRGLTLTKSDASMAAAGTPSVSEAAALAAAGDGARLAGPGSRVGRVTCAIAFGDGRMTVHFIGAGPGAADLITVRGRDLLGACPVCLYAGSIVSPELLRLLPARRAHRRHRAAVARRDRGRICLGARGGRGCRAAAFGRSFGLERGGRADPAAGEARHSLHADAGRALLRGGGGRTRPRADHSGGRAVAGADARFGPRIEDASRRDACRVRRDRRDAGNPSGDPRDRRHRRGADAALRQPTAR